MFTPIDLPITSAKSRYTYVEMRRDEIFAFSCAKNSYCNLKNYCTDKLRRNRVAIVSQTAVVLRLSFDSFTGAGDFAAGRAAGSRESWVRGILKENRTRRIFAES